MGTVVASDILDRASIILQDSTNVRFPESELLDFLNDAQREIVLHRPDANMQNADMTLVAGSKQSIPAGGLRLIDVIRNAGGKAITQVNREVLDETLPIGMKQRRELTRFSTTSMTPLTQRIFMCIQRHKLYGC